MTGWSPPFDKALFATISGEISVFIYMTVAAVAWGTGGPVASLLYQGSGLGPIAVSWWRFAIGAALMAMFMRTPRITFERSSVMAGVGMAVSQTAYFAAIGYSGVAVATAITLGVSPLLVALGERVMLAERIGIWQTVTLVAALAGLCLLVFGGGKAVGEGPAGVSWLGSGLSLLSGASYAAVILVRRAKGSMGDTMPSFVVGGMCLLPLALVEGILPSAEPVRAGVLLIYLGAVPTALAYGLFFAALSRVKATTAAVVALVEPLIAALIGVLWLGERMTVLAAAGAALLLASVAAYPFAGRGILIS